MRSIFVAAVIALTLAGCGNDPQTVTIDEQTAASVTQMKIADIDFNDADQVKGIADSLSITRRVGFMDYAVSRKEASAGNAEPEIARPDGSPPETIDEAIMLAREWRAGDD